MGTLVAGRQQRHSWGEPARSTHHRYYPVVHMRLRDHGGHPQAVVEEYSSGVEGKRRCCVSSGFTLGSLGMNTNNILGVPLFFSGSESWRVSIIYNINKIWVLIPGLTVRRHRLRT